MEKNNYWLRRLNAGEVEAVAGKDKRLTNDDCI
ncbi:hypothetical protein J4530_12130 [Neisseria subflava]|nr:hypothetical protein [Neisseria subflava]